MRGMVTASLVVSLRCCCSNNSFLITAVVCHLPCQQQAAVCLTYGMHGMVTASLVVSALPMRAVPGVILCIAAPPLADAVQ
jgi:hypothetical protein